MNTSTIYLGEGNMPEEDKKDRLYAIGFIVVIIIIVVILAVVIGGSYSQNSKPVQVVKPVTPTPQGSVQSAESSDQQSSPVERLIAPNDNTITTPTSLPTKTPTPTAKPTSSPTNIPTSTPSITPTPTITPSPTPSITPTPDVTPGP